MHATFLYLYQHFIPMYCVEYNLTDNLNISVFLFCITTFFYYLVPFLLPHFVHSPQLVVTFPVSPTTPYPTMKTTTTGLLFLCVSHMTGYRHFCTTIHYALYAILPAFQVVLLACLLPGDLRVAATVHSPIQLSSSLVMMVVGGHCCVCPHCFCCLCQLYLQLLPLFLPSFPSPPYHGRRWEEKECPLLFGLYTGSSSPL